MRHEGSEVGGCAPADPTVLYELAVAYWRSAALFAGIELGVFAAAGEEARTAADLAGTLGLPERSCTMLLAALAAVDLLGEEPEGHFRTTPVSAHYLRPGSPDYLGDAILFNARAYAAWGKLAATVRADTPAQSHGHVLGEDPEATRNFVYAMHGRAQGPGRCLAALLDVASCRRLLDLGGGPGSYSLLLAERFPQLQCTVMDLPAVVAVAREIIEQSPARDRVTVRAGDMFVDELGTDYDAVLLSGVLHRTEGEQTVALLRRVTAALAPDGVVAISDLFVGGENRGPVLPELFSLQMLLTADAGQSLSLPRLPEILAAAGLRLVQTIPFPPPLPHTVCLARRPEA